MAFNNKIAQQFKKLIERSVYIQDTIFKAINLSIAFLLIWIFAIRAAILLKGLNRLAPEALFSI